MSAISNLERLALARKSLIGLSIGDSFGESFFGEEKAILERIENRELKDMLWHFTDDTIMGIGVYKILEQHGEIKQNELAEVFALNYSKDIMRGYGGTAHSILNAIGIGEDWRNVSKNAFDGMGSMGNGAAMRVAPIGAYFYDNLEKIKEQAILSAEVTHFNEEGIAGAVAVAIASGLMVQNKIKGCRIVPENFIEEVFHYTPESDTKYKIRKALNVSKECNIDFAVSVLGNGSRVISQDTVPISIWTIANFNESYEEALWKVVSALGDRDTIGAIVGSVVILNKVVEDIPKTWLEYSEPFEKSDFWK